MPMTGVTDDADNDKHDDDGHDHVINDDNNDDACNKKDLVWPLPMTLATTRRMR